MAILQLLYVQVQIQIQYSRTLYDQAEQEVPPTQICCGRKVFVYIQLPVTFGHKIYEV